MEVSVLEQKYSELIKDDIFDLLGMKINEPNIFKILGVQNFEIRHSNFLGWLLNPNENHGLGDFFLLRFLQDIFLDNRVEGVSVIHLANIDNKKVSIRREWENIDILIITEDFVVCIENKIWSNEHSDQLIKYKTTIEDKFPNKKQIFVFLSPNGNESTMNHAFVNYSYERIIEILEALLSRASLSISKTIERYIQDYLTILKQNLMQNDEVNNLAEQLYKNHQELFDFVFQNKPNHRSYFKPILNEFIAKKGWIEGTKNKNYLRFTTPKIKNHIPPYEVQNGGWKNKEKLLFEFVLWSDTYIYFQLGIAPGHHQEKIKQILDPEAENDKFKMWRVLFGTPLNFKYKTINDLKTPEFANELNGFLDNITTVVEEVENKLIQYYN